MERDFFQEPGARSIQAAGPSLPRKTVERLALVVEDEWLVRLELASALEAAGWTVSETNSGEEAFAMLQAGERFDLVVTDIRLDGPVTGWDVAEAYRASNPCIGVVYASANSAQQDRLVSGSVFVSKPVRMDELVMACERLWKATSKDPPS